MALVVEPAGLTVNVREVEEDLEICKENLSGICLRGYQCGLHHYTLPYIWQVYLYGQGWRNLLDETPSIEAEFCNVASNGICIMIPAMLAGQSIPITVGIDFQSMEAYITSEQIVLPPECARAPTRRLSTASYGKFVSEASGTGCESEGLQLFTTQWRWYWCGNQRWMQFNHDGQSPMQSVIEAKFQARQEIYRFERSIGVASPTQSPLVLLLDLQNKNLTCLNDAGSWPVRRRPVLVTGCEVQAGIIPTSPPIKKIPFSNIPENWFPGDPDQVAELIPLNPGHLQYHLVASEFFNSIPPDRDIQDIYTVQNHYLWNKYHGRKQYMLHQKKQPNEKQLFHGTSVESSVQAILKQNFDWRINGKNATNFGKGAYFARDAAFSDRYTHPRADKRCWMFMARVMVGAYTKGCTHYVRPPPLDPALPHGDLYDSCVDSEQSPSIYVAFDSDQCYPEYLISYKLKHSS